MQTLLIREQNHLSPPDYLHQQRQEPLELDIYLIDLFLFTYIYIISSNISLFMDTPEFIFKTKLAEKSRQHHKR